jgi:hypothetical protein
MLSSDFLPSLVSGYFPRDLLTIVLWAFVMFRILVTRSVVLMWLRRSDAIFNTGHDTMRPAYSLEPKCSVTLSTREEWNKRPRPPPVLKGLVWFTNGSRTQWGARAGVFWRSWRRIDVEEFSRPRFALPWPVAAKFEGRLDQRNISVFSVIVKHHWQLFGLLKLGPHRYGSAKGGWVTFPPTSLWDSFGSLDILVYVEMKLLMMEQGRVLFTSFLDQSQPWGSRGRICIKNQVLAVNQHATMWQGLTSCQREAWELICGVVLLLGLGYCPLVGSSPVQFLAFLPDITLSQGISTWLGWWTVPCVGDVEQRRKPQPTFCVGVKLRRHSDILVCVPPPPNFTLRMLEVLRLGAIWNFDSESSLRSTKGL